MLASKIDQLLQKSDYIGSIYVRKNNRVLLEKGYGYANLRVKESNSPSIYYQIGSIQKAMTALLILKQIQAGKLTFDTKLAEFYPQIPEVSKSQSKICFICALVFIELLLPTNLCRIVKSFSSPFII